MEKKRKSLNTVLILCFMIFLISFGAVDSFAQLPEEINQQRNPLEEPFTPDEATLLVLPTGPDDVRFEMMMSDADLKESLADAFAMLDVEGAEQIIDAYLANGFTLSEIAEILRLANFSLEDTFQSMINKLGEGSLQEIIGALLEGNFKSSDVFKVAINHLKEVSPELTDDEIIETILGEAVDPDLFKSLQQEIFMRKISGVSYPVQRDLVLAMIDAGFTLDEITMALSENGFSLAKIAKIYALADIDVNVTYDLLIAIDGGQEITDVLRALLESNYSADDVFECLVNKLSATHTVEEIMAIVVGDIGDEGPTADQLNNAIILAGVLHDGTNTSEICEAVLSAGFDLENAAAVLNGIGIGLEDSFAILLNAQGGQSVADVTAVLISNGYDVHAVFTLSVAELKIQGFNLEEIVNLLIGEIDPEVGATKTQMDNALILVDVFVIALDSLDSIAGALITQGFGLENTADLLKDSGVSLEQTYTILVGVSNNEYASVAIAMINVGFSIDEVMNLVVTDLKVAGYTIEDIVLMLVGTVETDKNPTSKQLNRASSLVKLLVAQGDSLQEIDEELVDIGFDLDYVAKALKKANISTEDAFVVMFNIDGGQGYETVCNSLKTGGYNTTELFEIAVTELKTLDYDIDAIVNFLIGAVDPDTGPTGTQNANAIYLIKYLVAEGESLQEICEAFKSIGFTLTNIAKAMKSANVSLDDIFTEMLNIDGGQDIVEVCVALINGGYNAKSTFEITVTELKAQGISNTATIINMLIGTVNPDDGLSNYQNKNANYLIQVLSADGSTMEEICAGFLNTGFSLEEIATATKKADMDLMETYTALLNVGGQPSIDVINALNKAGYTISTLFSTIAPALLAQGHSPDDIITMLIGEIDPVDGATSQQLLNIALLAAEFSDAGQANGDICNALASAGFDLETTAKIVFSMMVDFNQAYDVLLTAFGGNDVVGVGLAMINANYDIDAVLDIVVTALEGQTLEMPEIISQIIEGTESASLKLTIAIKLVDIFTAKLETIADIADALFSGGISIDNIAVILKGEELDFDEAYNILIAIGGGQDIIDVAMALMSGGYDDETVIIRVVSVLKGQGYTNAQIISSFLGTIDPEGGPTAQQFLYSAFLMQQFQEAGDLLEDICADFASQGFVIEAAVEVMQLAGISTEDTFDVLLNFEGGQDAIDLALMLVDGGFESDEVFELLVNNLKLAEYSIEQIFQMVIGDIDPEDGITGTQLGYARDLAKAMQATGESLDDIAAGLFNYGLTLDETVYTFKQAGFGIEETYVCLMAVYVPETDEIANRSITASMISVGYDAFDVYAVAVQKLADIGITNDVDIIEILIGETDPEDTQQISNAGKLAKVLEYNADKLTADNTVASFIDLLKSGYTFTQISQMLLDGGLFTQEEIDETFALGFNEIVKELAKSGESAVSIISKLITADNKAVYITPLAEQLKRNNFSKSTIQMAFVVMPGGMNYYTDWPLIDAGLDDAADYTLMTSDEAITAIDMLNNGSTLTEVSQYFAEQGWQMSYVAKLFKTIGNSDDIDDITLLSVTEIFIALEGTKTFYSNDLMTNDMAAVITLQLYYADSEVFDVATKYYKDMGLSPDEIVFKLMSATVNVDTTSVLADTLVGQYYNSMAMLQIPSFITLMNAGYSITWIKDALMEKGNTEADIEAFIQDGDNFSDIYQGLRNKRMSASNIVKYFKVEESPGEYTVLLAENMIKDEISEEEVRKTLLGYNADSDLIEEGILRGLA